MSHIRLASILCVGLMACGSANAPLHEHPAPLSAHEHAQQADDHTTRADESSEKASVEKSNQNAIQCIDHGVPLSSGGEEIHAMRPCWTAAGSSEAYRRESDFHRKAAAQHKDWAAKLRRAERSACAELSQSDRDHSPFLHRKDILSSVEYRESGELKGAQVTFRKVPGLTVKWMSHAVQCHQARAAVVGFDDSFLPYCPLVVRSAAASVEEHKNTIVVTIRSDDPTMAAVIYGRSGEPRAE